MKQSNDINSSRLRDILTKARAIDDTIENGFKSRYETDEKPLNKSPKGGKGIIDKIKSKFKLIWGKIKSIFNKKPTPLPETDEEANSKIINEIIEKHKAEHFINDYENKFNVKIDNVNRVMDLFPNETIERDLPKNCSGGNVGGHKAPLYYEPLYVDIHNELAADLNTKTLKELKLIEVAGDNRQLRLQDIHSEQKKGLRGKFKINQTDFFKKLKITDKVKKSVTTKVDKKLEMALDFYGRKLPENKRDEVREKIMNDMRVAESSIVKSHIEGIVDKQNKSNDSSFDWTKL